MGQHAFAGSKDPLNLTRHQVHHILKLAEATSHQENRLGWPDPDQVAHALWHLSEKASVEHFQLILLVKDQMQNCRVSFDCNSPGAWLQWSLRYLRFPANLRPFLFPRRFGSNPPLDKIDAIVGAVAKANPNFKYGVFNDQFGENMLEALIYTMLGGEAPFECLLREILASMFNTSPNAAFIEKVTKAAADGGWTLELLLALHRALGSPLFTWLNGGNENSATFLNSETSYNLIQVERRK
jgi:hypothetical protein